MKLTELLLLIIPMLTTIAGAYAKGWYQKWKTSKFQLTDHPLITDLATHIREVNNWWVKQNREVFKDALEIKLIIWKEESIKLAEKLQKNSYSNPKLLQEVSDWANKVILLYTEKWKREDIPQRVINRITEVHQEKVNQLFDEIKDIVYNDTMYPFKMQKSIAIFGTLRLLLADTKNDFNKLVHKKEYNGYFKDVKYKDCHINDKQFNEQKENEKND